MSEQINRLKELLKDMDVPSGRLNPTINDIRWLSRNLGIRNSQHPNFAEANDIIKAILRKNNGVVANTLATPEPLISMSAAGEDQC